jgi:hypothetical protein
MKWNVWSPSSNEMKWNEMFLIFHQYMWNEIYENTSFSRNFIGFQWTKKGPPMKWNPWLSFMLTLYKKNKKNKACQIPLWLKIKIIGREGVRAKELVWVKAVKGKTEHGGRIRTLCSLLLWDNLEPDCLERLKKQHLSPLDLPVFNPPKPQVSGYSALCSGGPAVSYCACLGWVLPGLRHAWKGAILACHAHFLHLSFPVSLICF